MLRWVVLALLALNLVYLGVGLYRAHHADPYAGVPPPTHPAREIRLLDSLVDTPPRQDTRWPDRTPRSLPGGPQEEAMP